MKTFFAVLTVLVFSGVLGDISGDPYYRSEKVAANFAIGFHNIINKYPYAYKVMDILSASAQLYPPARVKFTMDVKVGQTVCENKPHINLDACNLQSPAELKTMTCHFVVLAVPNSDIPSYLLVDQCK